MAGVSGEPAFAIETNRLTKQYGSITALTDVSLAVPTGTIYGFLGPNGAGKTTTIKILLGFIKATSGTARIFGHETWSNGVQARRDLGFLVQPDNLFPDMTGLAHLTYAERLSGKRSPLRSWLLNALELSEEATKRKLGSYSKGMRQKLALVCAIQSDPRLLILDEPTDGLDPLIQRNFDEVLLELRNLGRTIFMSSHDLAEVERTCDRVAVVKAGRLIAEETVASLQRLHRRRAVVTFAAELPAFASAPESATLIEREGRKFTYLIEDDVNPLLRYLAAVGVEDVTISPPSLDDIFMAFYDSPNPVVTEVNETPMLAASGERR